jgi:prolyl 4-hydroxylase
MFDDEALARALFERARSALPETLRGAPRTTDRDGPTWRASGLNERFRGYRYGPGQRFAPHFDGCFARPKDEQSAITFLVYLDGDCEGGETRLLDYRVTVRPTKGLLLMFDHYVLHEGATVTAGVKHALRSDVMYTREP